MLETRQVLRKGAINFQELRFESPSLRHYIGKKVWVRRDVVESDILVFDYDTQDFLGLATNKELWDKMVETANKSLNTDPERRGDNSEAN